MLEGPGVRSDAGHDEMPVICPVGFTQRWRLSLGQERGPGSALPS
jgi:hypothetical protein